MSSAFNLGAVCLDDDRCGFAVWAPLAGEVEAHIVEPTERYLPLGRGERGYHHAVVEGVRPGSRYVYRLDGLGEYPDPASRLQPAGVHGPSQVVGGGFPWDDDGWSGLPLHDYVIYELHVGTYSDEGTFDFAVPHLDELKDLGVTAVELMPVAQFPGNRNWGYDGVYPFAVQHSYGGPEGLKRLVNACHRRGLAVVMDVVYNHLGPEGNYLPKFAPYFTERYRTPWGPALNFDGPDSDEVRRFFVENALYWITEFHVDALRLDAVHAILDHSPHTFLEELAAAVHERARSLGRQVHLFAESADNDKRLVSPPQLGGYGLDAQWNDDFHHSLHVLLTGERAGYYQDYGRLAHLVKAIREGFVYSGEYSPFRRRRHGSSSQHIPAHRFVVCAQNHDQVGNRMMGERLAALVSHEALKVAAGLVILSPYVPLLFMGEEYGETAPFLYFVDHSDEVLVDQVRRGRKDEFAGFGWPGEPPDPKDEATFRAGRLQRHLRSRGTHQSLLRFYSELLRLRRSTPALSRLSKDTLEVEGFEESGVILMRRWSGDDEAAAAFNLGKTPAAVGLSLPQGSWRRVLDSAEAQWNGPGSRVPEVLASDGEVQLTLQPLSCVLFARDKET